MFTAIAFLLLGLLVLIIGGEFLLKGAVGIAKKFRISSLVIGMTVVAFGTSAPEFIVSLTSVLQGHPEIAISNVVGSNIANLALVLGLTCIVFPVVVSRNTKTLDFPKMMFATLLFLVFAYDGVIERWEGMTLLVALITFIVYIVRNSIKHAHVAEDMEPAPPIRISALFLLIGLVGLYFGSDWFLNGAVNLARQLGMTEHVIGVTIVAFGTSVPELVTSIVAAMKKETDISIGNLIGSNVFNISAVVGITAIVSPVSIQNNLFNFDMYWLIGIPILLFLLMWRNKIGRLSGSLLFGTYVAYIMVTLFWPL
ncbi:calcium/sodium antiporter [Crocinitomicaceae bacterium]|nr:calcium/sodium antiporter [Crocinitomicaceae bacterium]MDC1186663.1 calcium/sodium antiporter [Crocinitomicaceae bacterium]